MWGSVSVEWEEELANASFSLPTPDVVLVASASLLNDGSLSLDDGGYGEARSSGDLGVCFKSGL